MSFQIDNVLNNKITAVNGVPGDIVIFGIDGTIADSGVPVSVGSGQAKQPSAVPGDIAIFGSGTNQGQTIDSGLIVDDAGGPSSNVLWSSQKIETLIPGGGPFLPLSGGTMTGTITSANIVVPTGDVITITDLPTVGTSAANKTYVDSKVSPGGPFLPLAGGTLTGTLTSENIIVPSGDIISIADLPTAPTSAANKAYVDAQVSAGVPDATPTVLGKIQLSGDFDPSSTATDPIIVSATTSREGKIQLAGDLTGTATSPIVAPGVITLDKMAPLSALSKLMGSSDTSTTVTQIGVGGSLEILGGILQENIPSLSNTFLPLAGGTMSGNIIVPTGDFISITDPPSVGTGAANKAYVDTNITPNATPTVLGKIQLTGDLGGTATTPVVAPGAITLSKMANLNAISNLIGSSNTSVTPSDISLGSNLQMTGTTLNVNTTALSGSFLPLTGGMMSGNIIIPTGDIISIADAPTVGTSAANKTYVDSQISNNATPNATATVLGKIQLTGDLLGSVATLPTVAPGSITLSKLSNLSAPSELIGSSSTSSAPADITLGTSLVMSGTSLNVVPNFLNPTFNGTISGSAILGVPNGGTGDSTLTGFIVGNGTAPFTAVTTIPVSSVSGAVESVNGVFPDISGNVTVALGTVTTGTLANLPAVGPPLVNGDIYVVSGDPTPSNNGLTFIYSTTPTNQWLEISPSFATLDARYLQLAGGTMAGNIVIQSGNIITLTSAPINPTDAANKSYVDANITPSATTLIQGKIQLAGDLAGTASVPVVTTGAITLPKMANLTTTSALIGSSSTSTSPAQLSLGSNLQILGTVLDVNTTTLSGIFLPLTGGTMSGNIVMPSGDVVTLIGAPINPTDAANKAYVDANVTPNATATVLGKIQLTGDLLGSVATLPTVAPGAITLSKMANLTSTMSLIGSSSTSNVAAQLSLGSDLQISGTVLDVNTAALSTTFLPLAGGTMSGNIIVPTGDSISIADAPIVGTSAANKAYVDAQVASATPQATATVFGTIKLAGDLLGSTANAPTIAPLAITVGKLANLGAPSEILGSGSTSSAAAQLSLGSFLQISGTTLNANTTNLSTIFLPLAGGTMSGNIIVPTGDLISIADPPTMSTSAVNKAYVDAQIIAGTPPATTTSLGTIQLAGDFDPSSTATVPVIKSATAAVQGKIMLAGDLTGSAASPTVAPGVITLAKMANLSGTSELIGSSSTSTTPTDITLGSGLQISGTVLSVNSATLTVPPATATTIGGIEMLGDLTGSVATAPTVAPGAITLTKMANLSGTSELIGSSSTSTVASDITLGSGLQISGTVLSVTGATASTLGGIEMLGDLTGSSAISPTVAPGAITLAKMANLSGTSELIGSSSTATTPVDITLGSGLQISGTVLSVNPATLTVPPATATTLGGIEMLGDLTGSVATSPTVASGAITLAKMANLSGTSQIIGSSSTTTTPTDLTLGSGLQISGTVLSVNSATLTVPPATATTIGGIEMLGDLTGSVATAPTVASGAITLAKMANLSGNSELIGSSSTSSAPVDITLASSLQMAGTVLGVNTTTLSSTFLPLAGGTMAGNIIVPTGDLISITDTPIVGTSAANKTYVDSQITANATPPATTSVEGKIQLAGDLGGAGTVASAPVISSGAVTLTKMANLSGSSQLLGSGSTSSSPVDITLGSGLQISGTVMSVNSATLVVPPATATTIGGIEMLGDLTGSVATAPTVAPGAITLAKMANLSGTSELIGSSSTTATPVDITLGSGLQISGTVMSVNSATLVVPPATATTIGGIEMLGDLTGSVATAPTVSPGAITLAKMANLSGTSQIIGSSSTAATPVDLTLGTGLQISGTVMSVNSATLVVPPATATTIGGIEMLGDLTGSVATLPTVAPGAITLAKMANLSGTSQIIGSSSTAATPVDLTLGTGLQISGTVLSIIPKTVNSATRTFTASTGATGFQISATFGAFVYYSVSISTTIGVGGTSTGTVFLEVSPTNSATPASWIVNGQASNSQSFAGLLTLTSVQVEGSQLSTYVPPGFFAKLRTTSSGTASFTFIAGVEVIDI